MLMDTMWQTVAVGMPVYQEVLCYSISEFLFIDFHRR